MNTNTIALQTLIKQAAPAKLNDEDTQFSWRHLLAPARIEALQGATPQEQVDANWNSLKLLGGSTLGSIGGSTLGAVVGGILANKKENGILAGALAGALPGYLLGNWLTYRTMRKNRGMDDDFSWRHLLAPAQYEGIRGGTKEQQVNANMDGLITDVPGMLASAIGTPAAAYPVSLASYYALRNHRLNK